MDLRYNHGEGFSIPQEPDLQFLGSWMPPTPERSVPRVSNLMPIGRDGNQMSRMNWPELPPFPSGAPQKFFGSNTVPDNFWQIDNVGRQGQFSYQNSEIGAFNFEMGRPSKYSYLQDVYDASGIYDQVDSSVNLMAAKSASSFNPHNFSFRETMSTASIPAIPILQPEVNNYREASSRVPHATNCNYQSNSNQLYRHCLPQQHPDRADGFPLAFLAGYDLNSPPRTEEDTTFNSLQLPPETPDKASMRENNSGSTVYPLAEKCSMAERNKQHDLVITAENEVNGSNFGELRHLIGDSSSVLASPSDEPKESNEGIFQGIDLNKTPQLKPPRRKKHRPKVIVEGEPKRNPKPSPKASDSKETPTQKRKYVRKMASNKSATEPTAPFEQKLSSAGNTAVENVLNSNKGNGKRKYVRKKQELETQHECSAGGVNINAGNKETAICDTDPKTPPIGKRKYDHKKGLEESNQHSIPDAAKSCRRSLRFESVNPRDQEHNTNIKQQEMADNEKVVFNLNAYPEATGTSNVVNDKMQRAMSVQQIGQQNRLQEQSRHIDAVRNFSPSMNQKTSGNMAISGGQTVEAQRGPPKSQMENLHTNAMGVLQQINEQIVFPEKINYEVFQNLKSRNNAESINYSVGSNESKRGHCPMEQRNPYMANVVRPSLLSQKVFLTDNQHQKHSSNISRYQIGCEMQTNASVMANHATAINYPIPGAIRISDVHSCGFPSKHSYGPWESHSMINNVNEKTQKLTADCNIHLMAGNKMPKMAVGSDTVIRVLNGDKLPQVSLHTGSISAHQMQPDTCSTDFSRNQQIMEYPLQNLGSSEKGILQKENNVKGLKHVKRRGTAQKQRFCTVEDITKQMESLNLISQEDSALVLYKSGGGEVVPYNGFDFLKKRKPRPKVDLDPETERVWNLLMWKEGSKDTEGTNEEKEKWWEEERRIFHGRVDSFIARMHLVQGDRRFSKWKGSVVDSVIGVFLTQNVSDHLSSSAFMHLAARFPLKPGKNTSSRNEMNILVDEPVACILSPDTSIKWHEMSSSCKTIEHQRDNSVSWIERISNREMRCQNQEEEVLSSQESFGSSVIQVNGMGSSSGSNSEAEDPATGCKPNSKHSSYSPDLQEFYSQNFEKSLFERASWHRHQPTEEIENWQQRQNMQGLDSGKGLSTSNMQIHYANPLVQPQAVPSNHWLQTDPQFGRQLERFESFAEETISSWPSATSRFAVEKDVCCPDKRIGLWEETSCKIPLQNFGQIRNQESVIPAPHALTSKHSLCGNSNFQSTKITHEMSEIFQRENNVMTYPTNLAESLARSQNACRQHVSDVPKFTGEFFDAENSSTLADNPTNLGHKLIEPNSKKVHSIDEGSTQLNANPSKTRKRKAESNKKNAVDWESLRLQVEPNGSKKERSKETMDSLDYEALRSASVKEISETIKERGMNNMLAERIKEFLDRLVTDHGSIDLEWLRDAPPEEGKKYLLSIRGLGLKSVECVRLLTLHHLAFPVDTNVGRIAVRLGWVPLRPLPESLQLHLLELYPILESIQKYLWPRLCKLDQRTLYELHYQLITFGKVFCTKSKPNCNACPMRAECRHFASAFASARLALPGPEEKSIMPTTVPFTAEKNSGIVIDPMPLPSLEHDIIQRAGTVFGSCVPIVEEPASPEQQVELVESDIEDSFSEDPDEIPTIKLNMEQFTENLQNYMQSNMEIQEVDMSKALVALNPGAASIPTSKLKNISRLRTEHQVYELPDSHPLLKEMDAREPDDPSPYLLAIWTPGETATSIQPPEQECQFQGTGKLCNADTCFSCNSIREANSQTVRGTILVPCRTAMRGSFPLNGTYFQVNEVFADHESSLNPIDVPRAWIWNLPRRIVYFGTSVTTIFKGLTTEGIQFCFWRGFVCVRGFEQKTRAPRPLIARLHFPASRLAKAKNEKK